MGLNMRIRNMGNKDTDQAAAVAGPEAGHPGHHPHKVPVTIDGARKEIEAGDYVVSALKLKLGVPADYELDQVINGEFRPLNDNAHVDIKGGEHFISHVRRGGSS
jgi:hypothetical protein